MGSTFGVPPVPGLDECIALARGADAAVVCVGFDPITESEGYDRDFKMHDALEQLIEGVAAVQPRTVVVLTAGGNVDMSGWIDRVGGLLHAWYPGQAGGQAIAEILLGTVNPSGRLVASFEKRLEDGSSFGSYHDADGDRRVQLSDGVFTGYRHFDRSGIEPRFPFGFGLSYTTFDYESLELGRTSLEPGGELEVVVQLCNTGRRAGAEVVQLYVRELAPRLPRPDKELKAFRKVWLEAGERQRVSLRIDRRALEFYDSVQHAFTYEPGRFEVAIGRSASEIVLRQDFVAR